MYIQFQRIYSQKNHGFIRPGFTNDIETQTYSIGSQVYRKSVTNKK